MEKEYLKIIRVNRPIIVDMLRNDASTTSLLTLLLAQGVLTRNEHDDTMANRTPADKVRAILDHIERKPRVFQTFLNALSHESVGADDLAKLLVPNFVPDKPPPRSAASVATPAATPAVTLATPATASPVVADVLPGNTRIKPKYIMGHEHVGHVLIINNEDYGSTSTERFGSDKDRDALSELFKGVLKFDAHHVTTKDNLREATMKRVILEYADPRKHQNSGCFICVILAHGNEGIVEGTDGGHVNIDADIIKPIQDCPTLIGKPKIFIIQACRGNDLDSGHVQRDGDETAINGPIAQEEQHVELKCVPTMCDVLVAYPTVKGFAAFRNDSRFTGGSWFIQSLVKVISESWQEDHLIEMLTEVNRQVSEQVGLVDYKKVYAVANFTSSLTKRFYLKREVIRE